jgi:hypothetical protein
MLMCDCFASTDWNTFQDSANIIDELTTSISGNEGSLLPNKKPWINTETCNKLNDKATAQRTNTAIPRLRRRTQMRI